MKIENIKNWKPTFTGFGDNSGKILNYDRSWFCFETNNIHHSEKSVLNCQHCKTKYHN